MTGVTVFAYYRRHVQRMSTLRIPALGVDRLAAALRQGHRVSRCACGGPVVNSRKTVRSRRFRCGQRYLVDQAVDGCPACGGWFVLTATQQREHARRALDQANGQLRIEDLPTCGCEREESSARKVSLQRPSWRRCLRCTCLMVGEPRRARFCRRCVPLQRRDRARVRRRRAAGWDVAFSS